MLDPRAQHLLKSLIERYIADGQPVGSRVLSRQSGLELSPATIRNVMADLEEMGFIASPHTSAGRVPTPTGYRFFVDSLLVAADQGEIRNCRINSTPTGRSVRQYRGAIIVAPPARGRRQTPRRKEARFGTWNFCPSERRYCRSSLR